MNGQENKQEDTVREFEAALKGLNQEKYVFRLFIAGCSPKSVQAIENIRCICNEYFARQILA